MITSETVALTEDYVAVVNVVNVTTCEGEGMPNNIFNVLIFLSTSSSLRGTARGIGVFHPSLAAELR